MAPADRKSFSGEAPRPGLWFDLNEESFLTVGDVPGGAMNDLMAGIQLDEQNNKIYSAPNLMQFMRACLAETETITVPDAVARGIDGIHDDDIDWLSFEQCKQLRIDTGKVGEQDTRDGLVPVVDIATNAERRFDHELRRKDRVVTVETLADIAFWIAEQLLDRPFQPSVVSRRGRR